MIMPSMRCLHLPNNNIFDNKCYYVHIKDQNLIWEMNNCRKNKRSKTVANRLGKFKTYIEIYL